MSKNIFTRTNEHVKSVKRNSFDLSFQNNLTMNFGALYPVFCKEVMPGDSMSIQPTFGLNFMPTFFPVQTRMRANMHFFYVRNRNLWSGWMDFIGKTKDNLVPPFLNINTEPRLKRLVGTGSIGDYLGIPSTLVGKFGTKVKYTFTATTDAQPVMSDVLPVNDGDIEFQDYVQSVNWSDISNGDSITGSTGTAIMGTQDNLVFTPESKITLDFSGFDATVLPGTCNAYVALYDVNGRYLTSQYAGFYDITKPVILGMDTWLNPVLDWTIPKRVGIFFDIATSLNLFTTATPKAFKPGTARIQFGVDNGNDEPNVQEISLESSPFYSSTSANRDRQIRLSALPFRAYESIYNAFYRDIRNNPYILNGQPEYNTYIPSLEGGADIVDYAIRYRNWEQDFLTSAVQSPQQGVAPLVGITDSGSAAFSDDSGTYEATFERGEDGESFRGLTLTKSDKSLTEITVNALATSGISISDFRAVNALQLWLEANNRVGLRYRDQMRAHYDVNIRFDELQMPEFIGGVSEDVSVYQVNQQSDSADMPLGSYAGQASCRGTSKHRINHFCDEHGFIIGIMCVVPVPNYSQLLPKLFTKSAPLDYFFPEFGHISMQPVMYNEVCPIQAYNDNPSSLKDTFGYQRAWYDLLASTDEVHGLFRTNLRNFLINRVFDVKPQLSPSFLLIDPKQVNQVFSVTETTDKILGQVYFDVKAKRPIPMYGIPRLEV